MKRTTKALCTALVALMAGPAAATIAGPNTGNGELFITITDRDLVGTDGRSYTRDLGIRMNDFLPSPAGTGVTALGYTLSFAPDSLLVTFLSEVASDERRANLVWNIGAMDNIQQNRYLTTAKNISDAEIPINLALRTFDDNTASHLTNNNTRGTHPGGEGVHGSSVAGQADGPAYGGSANWGSNWAGSAFFDNTAKIGESMNFYLLANTTASGNNQAKADLTPYANTVGNATWTLAQDGALTFMAPVPEPGEWALMLSGLALVGWAARRRKQNTAA